MNELENYFNERLRSSMKCEFSDLSPTQKGIIIKTTAFAYYNFHKSLEVFKKEVDKAFIEGAKNISVVFEKMSNSLKDYK